jgi:hypothetical protein
MLCSDSNSFPSEWSISRVDILFDNIILMDRPTRSNGPQSQDSMTMISSTPLLTRWLPYHSMPILPANKREPLHLQLRLNLSQSPINNPPTFLEFLPLRRPYSGTPDHSNQFTMATHTPTDTMHFKVYNNSPNKVLEPSSSDQFTWNTTTKIPWHLSLDQ